MRKRRTIHNWKNDEERRLYWLKEHKSRWEKRRKEMPVLFKAERLLYYSKVRSKEKELPQPTITIPWIIQNIFRGCPRTGRKFVINNFSKRNMDAPSIHRFNNNEGYSPENCEVVIWAYNSGLSEHTEEDVYKMFKALLKKINHDE